MEGAAGRGGEEERLAGHGREKARQAQPLRWLLLLAAAFLFCFGLRVSDQTPP